MQTHRHTDRCHQNYYQVTSCVVINCDSTLQKIELTHSLHWKIMTESQKYLSCNVAASCDVDVSIVDDVFNMASIDVVAA